MTLWNLLLLLVGAGAILWLLEIAPFISAEIKPFIRWIILVAVVIVLLSAIGALEWLKRTTIG